MSENRHHSRVHIVPSAPVTCTGAVLAGAVIYSFIRLLSDGAQKAYKQLSAPVLPTESTQTLKPTTEMGYQTSAESKRIVQELHKYNLSQEESLKVSTLLKVANMPYMVENRETVLHPIENLIKAKSLESVIQAKDNFLKVVESGHQKVFVKALSTACKQAAIKIGFEKIHTMLGPADSIRLVATDATEVRSLVTEISNEKAPQLEYEIIGVTDGSCHQILDEYGKALETMGVRLAPPKRRFTRGVPHLKAAQEFMKKNVRPQVASNIQQRSKPSPPSRRVLRLNQPRKIQVRR